MQKDARGRPARLNVLKSRENEKGHGAWALVVLYVRI
jgi:hypothetical protein